MSSDLFDRIAEAAARLERAERAARQAAPNPELQEILAHPDPRERARRLYAAGRRAKDIAQMMRRSESTIRRWVRGTLRERPIPICVHDECRRRVHAKGECAYHYVKRLRAEGRAKN